MRLLVQHGCEFSQNPSVSHLHHWVQGAAEDWAGLPHDCIILLWSYQETRPLYDAAAPTDQMPPQSHRRILGSSLQIASVSSGVRADCPVLSDQLWTFRYLYSTLSKSIPMVTDKWAVNRCLQKSITISAGTIPQSPASVPIVTITEWRRGLDPCRTPTMWVIVSDMESLITWGEVIEMHSRTTFIWSTSACDFLHWFFPDENFTFKSEPGYCL